MFCACGGFEPAKEAVRTAGERRTEVRLCSALRAQTSPGDEAAQERRPQIKKTGRKYPRVIEFVDSLPMTISGKIRRALIRTLDSAKNTIIEPVKSVIGLDGNKDDEK